MQKFNVFELHIDGTWRKLSPEGGFSSEAGACGYALCKATSRWNNYSVYVVTGATGELVAVYWGCGVVAIEEMADGVDIEEADNPEEMLHVRRAA